MSVGYIPMSEIEAYVNLFGIKRKVLFVTVIRELDQIFMDRQNKKADNPKHNGTDRKT